MTKFTVIVVKAGEISSYTEYDDYVPAKKHYDELFRKDEEKWVLLSKTLCESLYDSDSQKMTQVPQ